ncbi:MAG: DUF4349 domain-containing protein [Sphingobacteriales bacterium JAD_PAG50586_3]|nr:MAG: DUF4349 domain-containing protein [Sphingobacteriales bacterium JAD_PAG50586_3]
MKPIYFKTLTLCSITVLAIACNNTDSKNTQIQSYKAEKAKSDSISSSGNYAPAMEESLEKDEDQSKTENKSISNGFADASDASLSSSAAQEPNDPAKKFVRTADLKFRVKEVVESTQQIEDITGKFGGYVAYTNLESQQVGSSVEPYGEDSLIEVSKYQLKNEMVLRVPNTRLDSLLREIGGLVDHFDYRKIEAGDVTLQYEMNKRSASVDRRVGGRIEDAIDSKGRRLYDITDAEDLVRSSSTSADAADIENLRLLNDVKYSKVTLSIYEKPNVMTSVVVSDAVYQKYKPSFGTRFVVALERSWNIVLEILLFFTQIWFLPFVGLVVYLSISLQ